MKATASDRNALALDDDLRDLLVATINPDNTVTLSDPNTGAVPLNMSYADVRVVGVDGTSIIIDGGDNPVVYTLTAPDKLEAYLVGREWVVTDEDIVDAFQNDRTDSPLGLIIVKLVASDMTDFRGLPNAQI